MKLKIALIDYGVGNTLSVYNALQALGYGPVLTNKRQQIEDARALVLPGVGAFEACINNIAALGLDEILHEQVLQKGKPILGICLGMQLMGTSSEENGFHLGFNWIPGKVKKLDVPEPYSVPHVGWNDLHIQAPENGLFSRLPEEPHFYFDHSYHISPDNPAHIAATCDYGAPITAAIHRENIYGVQFHPEKSQTSGLKLFRGFFNTVLHN